MEQKYNTSVATCPRCKAVCVVGHDEDGQVFCAKCGNSFRPEVTKELNEQEYRTLRENATQRHERASWTAFSVNNSI